MNAFDSLLRTSGQEPLRAERIDTLQMNLGFLCNQQCGHCHVHAGPADSRMMAEETIDRVLEILITNPIPCLDITGGAPELHPSFRRVVQESRAMGKRVIDRCNLTVLLLPGQEDTARFLRERRVEVYASLPCYTKDNVDSVRGEGVFDGSIRALQMLNGLGYGSSPDLVLNLVYNPSKPALPPSAGELEEDYRVELARLGIAFNSLIALANTPVGRFEQSLRRSGGMERYISLLTSSFNPETTPHLMCRHAVSVGCDGGLYDCDFNLSLSLRTNRCSPDHISRFSYEALRNRRIVTGDHCLACAAGVGSSCGGALVGAK